MELKDIIAIAWKRKLTVILVAAVWHPERLWGPQVAVCPERRSFALVSAHHGVEVLAPDAVDVADLHGGQRATSDPVADRLGGQLELRSDLLDCEELLVGHGWMPRGRNT